MWILYQFSRTRQAQRGLTLLEAMMVLPVIGVLLGLGLPEMSRFLQRQRLESTHSELRAALAYARGEAIRRSAQVTLCRRAAASGPAQCATGGRDWSAGWMVFVDRSAQSGSPDPVVGEILRVHESVEPQIKVSFTAPRGASLTYDGQGWPDRNFVGGSFKFCAKSYPDLGKRLISSRLGRLRSEPLDCPK